MCRRRCRTVTCRTVSRLGTHTNWYNMVRQNITLQGSSIFHTYHMYSYKLHNHLICYASKPPRQVHTSTYSYCSVIYPEVPLQTITCLYNGAPAYTLIVPVLSGVFLHAHVYPCIDQQVSQPLHVIISRITSSCGARTQMHL